MRKIADGEGAFRASYIKPASSSLLSLIYEALKAPSRFEIISPALRKILCTVSPAADVPISTSAKLESNW